MRKKIEKREKRGTHSADDGGGDRGMRQLSFTTGRSQREDPRTPAAEILKGP